IQQRADFDLSPLARFTLVSKAHVAGTSRRLQPRVLARWADVGLQPRFARSHVYLHHACCGRRGATTYHRFAVWVGVGVDRRWPRHRLRKSRLARKIRLAMEDFSSWWRAEKAAIRAARNGTFDSRQSASVCAPDYQPQHLEKATRFETLDPSC